MARPYIPGGCDQQGRVTPGKLTQAHLDRRIAEKTDARGLGEQLLSSGAVEGPFKHTRPWRRSRLRRFLRALLAFLAAPSAHL